MSDEEEHQNGGQEEMRAYLNKKTKNGKWQKRWFETNGCFLTYYKKQGQKLLAALNLPQVGDITLLDRNHPDGSGIFTIELNERLYTVQAPTHASASEWVNTLKAKQARETVAREAPRDIPAPIQIPPWDQAKSSLNAPTWEKRDETEQEKQPFCAGACKDCCVLQ